MKNFYPLFSSCLKNIDCVRLRLFFLMFSSLGYAEEKTNKNEELVKISEAMGHLIGKNLQSLGLSLDLDALVRGMQEASHGKESPLSEEDCMDAISHLQEETILKVLETNLQNASTYLEENKEKPGVVSLVDGKLQYQVLKKGDGKVVESYSKPLVRYSGKCLNGPSISQTEELLDLEETILGFKKGLIGMKEGEIRTLFIHPDLGYGTQPYPSPNSLLIFEVELMKADASSDDKTAQNLENMYMELPEKMQSIKQKSSF